jgi:hypothetical protein
MYISPIVSTLMVIEYLIYCSKKLNISLTKRRSLLISEINMYLASNDDKVAEH